MFAGAITALPPAPHQGTSLMVSRADGEILPTDSDESLALSFASEHADDLRHVAEMGRWLIWDGARWRPDRTAAAYYLVRAHLRNFAGAMHFQEARKVASAKTVAAVERMAKTDPRIATEAAMWDADPWILNTPGGVINLQTGQLRSARPGDHCTKITAVAPSGACPLWLTFLNRIMAGDADLIAFLQRALGYALTGITRDHAFFFLHGGGGNGKGVFLNTIVRILNDYATAAPIETFLASSFERHPTDIAGLAGSRLAVADEIPPGRSWDETKIKRLTGGDKIPARFMRQDFFEFTPQFKLVLVGNNRPRLHSVNAAIKRRLHLIPFAVEIPEAERDTALPERLHAELPGILAWLIEGCLSWQRVGLQPPLAVRFATDSYVAGEDVVGAWSEDCCEQVPDTWAPRELLFTSWSGWASRAGERIGTRAEFLEVLRQRFEERKRAGQRGFAGIRLKPAPALPDERISA
jgi:putative DNA primase/helicase